uniref:Bgt-20795 n=1 Tax=Blumeria graminis f. sp. tritici 96224 TaxID=1268274 RepID=A0A381L6Q8_BLUGR
MLAIRITLLLVIEAKLVLKYIYRTFLRELEPKFDLNGEQFVSGLCPIPKGRGTGM